MLDGPDLHYFASNTHIMYNNNLKQHGRKGQAISLSTCKLNLKLAADIAIAVTGTPYSTNIVHSQSHHENVVAQLTSGT